MKRMLHNSGEVRKDCPNRSTCSVDLVVESQPPGTVPIQEEKEAGSAAKDRKTEFRGKVPECFNCMNVLLKLLKSYLWKSY